MPSRQNCNLLLIFFVFFAGIAFAEPGPFLTPGQPAPVSSLQDLNDTVQTLPVSGQWSMVFFWSLFCHSCIEEMPIIAEEIGKIPPGRAQSFFITLDTAKMKKAVVNFLNKRHLNLNVVLEEIASDSYKTADLWGVKTTPSAFLVDPDGKVVFSREGPFDPEELLKILRQGLASGTAPALASDTASGALAIPLSASGAGILTVSEPASFSEQPVFPASHTNSPAAGRP